VVVTEIGIEPVVPAYRREARLRLNGNVRLTEKGEG
jgi:hypothetical protein